MFARNSNRHITYYDDEPYEFLPFGRFLTYKRLFDVVQRTRTIGFAAQLAGAAMTTA